MTASHGDGSRWWYRLGALVTVTLLALAPATAGRATAGPDDLAARSPGLNWFFSVVCCLIVVGFVVLLILLVKRSRRSDER
jgi:flagellar biogenesis protein FliO